MINGEILFAVHVLILYYAPIYTNSHFLRIIVGIAFFQSNSLHMGHHLSSNPHICMYSGYCIGALFEYSARTVNPYQVN